jgi:hypothetical protein
MDAKLEICAAKLETRITILDIFVAKQRVSEWANFLLDFLGHNVKVHTYI